MKKTLVLILFFYSFISFSQNFTFIELQNLNLKPWKTCETLLKQKGYMFSEDNKDSRTNKIYTYQINNNNNNSLNYIELHKCIVNDCGGVNSYASWYTPHKSNVTNIINQAKSSGFNLIKAGKDGDADTYEFTKGLERLYIFSQPRINKYVISVSMSNY